MDNKKKYVVCKYCSGDNLHCDYCKGVGWVKI